jgi:RNA polymerase sigma-70 factor (ECF subfamily)
LGLEQDKSDESLLSDAAAGDQGAFTTLMRRHEDRIFSLAYRITGNRSDALDATQDTFVSAFKQAARFRGESQFSTWLYRVGVNACNDLLRKKARTPVPSSDDMPVADDSGAPGVAEAASLRIDLSRALAELPADYREAVTLHDLGGVPYEEIAQLTGVAIGTVKSRISRGRRRLAEILEQPDRPPASKEET